MPNIVRAQGVHLTDDVVKIRDVLPTRIRKSEAGLAETEEQDDQKKVVILDVFEQIAAASVEEPGAEPDEPDPYAGMSAAMLQEAMDEADQIKEEARQAAEAEREQILAEAMAEAERLKQEAAAQGQQEGIQSAVSKVEETTQQIQEVIARMEGDQAGFELEYEEQLKWMALEVASKILSEKVEADDTILTNMVQRTVMGLRNESWIRVEIASEMTRLIGQLQDLYDTADNIEISAIPAQPGTVMIETPSGVVDASIKTQLENLKVYFQNS